MRKNNEGFTLVELLAVIVILGLLMAIAIPSVTKYITQSRVKTLVSTMDSYITAVVTQVNDGEYRFSDSTKIFAIPIECIALEKGGTNPFGNWYQANSAYWAYVLVHYDSVNYNYEYGFTFKDDAGYGLYPTLSSKIENSMVRTGYDDLKMPKDGKAIEFVSIDKWEGFSNITSSTMLEVLESESEGVEGNGKDTCTLCQKGDNYEQAEQEKMERSNTLANLIKRNNTIKTESPTLTMAASTAGEKGLYKSTDTNSGSPTYYFRGGVSNNYVKFAGATWYVIRVNEDDTVRLMYYDGIGPFNEGFIYPHTYSSDYKDVYYSNNTYVKPMLENWYQNNIVKAGLDDYVATGEFCEQAKVRYSELHTIGNANPPVYTEYTPNFRCTNDANGYGIVRSKIGLITYDELIFTGAWFDTNTYWDTPITYTSGHWTMSPSGVKGYGYVWIARQYGYVDAEQTGNVQNSHDISPVINIKANVKATGKGTSSNPYVLSLD